MYVITRRDFISRGVAAFTVGFSAPSFLCDLARAQGATGRSLVVIYLSGGNDALSTLVPYTDPYYYSRRPSIAIPAGSVLQIGSDQAGKPLGLHPRLVGLRQLFNAGRVALIPRAGYPNSSRSHFLGTDIWSTADPRSPSGPGWLGRYLDTLPSPVDPLVAWNTQRETPRTLQARLVGVPAIPSVQGYAFQTPNGGTDALYARAVAARIASHLPVDRPHVAFINATAQAALATLDRVAAVAQYRPTVVYPADGFGQALRMVAGALAREVGTKIFWVQTGGYDTHANQNTLAGTYANLMAVLDGGLTAFTTDLLNLGLFNQTLIVQFSEFGRRINENGSAGTDHGAAGLMMVIGGAVRGGIYGTVASLNPAPDNPTLENRGQDVTHEVDFRAVYARIIDRWLGADAVALLGGAFHDSRLTFI